MRKKFKDIVLPQTLFTFLVIFPGAILSQEEYSGDQASYNLYEYTEDYPNYQPFDYYNYNGFQYPYNAYQYPYNGYQTSYNGYPYQYDNYPYENLYQYENYQYRNSFYPYGYQYNTMNQPQTYTSIDYSYNYPYTASKWEGTRSSIRFGSRFDKSDSYDFPSGISSYQGTSTGPGPNGGYPGAPRGIYPTNYLDTGQK